MSGWVDLWRRALGWLSSGGEAAGGSVVELSDSALYTVAAGDTAVYEVVVADTAVYAMALEDEAL